MTKFLLFAVSLDVRKIDEPNSMENTQLASIKDINRKTNFRYSTKQDLTEFLAGLNEIRNNHKHDLTIQVQENNKEANSISFSIQANNIRLTGLLVGQFKSLEDGTKIITGVAGIKGFSFTSGIVIFFAIGLIASLIYAQSNINLFFIYLIGAIVIESIVIYGYYVYANYIIGFLLKTLSNSVENK